MGSVSSRNDQLTNGMFQLFADKPLRPKSKQHRFDTREILDVTFICSPVATKSGGALLGIQLKLAKTYSINHIRDFLSKVEKESHFIVQMNLRIHQMYIVLNKRQTQLFSSLLKCIIMKNV